MSNYRKTEGGVIREADGAFIPQAEGNRDWQAYLAWCEKGGVALPLQSLEQAVAGKASELTQACADAIMAGFTATALGAPYTYDSTIEDQLNLTGLIQLGTIFASDANWKGGFKCADAEGVKEKRDHTLKQLQQVGVTFVQRKQALIDRKDVLVAKAQACTTVEQVEAIAWTEA